MAMVDLFEPVVQQSILTAEISDDLVKFGFLLKPFVISSLSFLELFHPLVVVELLGIVLFLVG